MAGIRDSLPPEQRASVGVLVGNYGEQGAIEILGLPYHLPALVLAFWRDRSFYQKRAEHPASRGSPRIGGADC